jgi:hypothetical protein
MPFIFLFWLPKRSTSIVQFLRENSVLVSGRGIVCVYSVLNPTDEEQDNSAQQTNHAFFSTNPTFNGDTGTSTPPIQTDIMYGSGSSQGLPERPSLTRYFPTLNNYAKAPALHDSDSDFSDDERSNETIIRMPNSGFVPMTQPVINGRASLYDNSESVNIEDVNDPFKQSMSLKYNHSCSNFKKTFKHQ